MIRSFLATPAGSELGGGLWLENPPDGPPTNVQELVFVGGTGEVTVQWSNGDATAYTQLGFNTEGEPTSVFILLPPGETSYETGDTASNGWWARHTRGGTPSAWVQAVFTAVV